MIIAAKKAIIAALSGHAVLSLKHRIILLTSFLVLVSTLIIGGMTYWQIEGLVFRTATEKLPRETLLLAQRFKQPYEDLRRDVLVLADTPPIAGLARSIQARGVDPVDGSTTQVWRERLGVIFAAQLNSRPEYTQVRYIGVADGGRELVRVNRTDSGIVVVPEVALQKKAAEPYFRAILDTPADAVHISEVTYNREFGRVESALIPTIRVGTPVFDDEGRLFGMVVVNARYDALLRQTLEDIAPQNNTFVVNNSGDYMEYTIDRGILPLELHDNYTRPVRDLIRQVVQSDRDGELIISDTAVSYFIRLSVSDTSPGMFIGVGQNIPYVSVVQRVPYGQLLAPAYEARTISMVVGGGLIVACLLVSIALARRFTAPIERMAREIKMSHGRMVPQNLPLNRLDEIGDLARAFDEKARELANIETKARAVINNVVDGLITIDEFGVVDSYNPACVRIFGYEKGEVIGKNISMLMPEPHRTLHQHYLSKYRKTGEQHIIGARRELEGRRKDGSTFPLELAVSELKLDNHRMFSGIIRDISERKQMEVMKDEFVSTVNHELRTPLTSIQGALGLLMMKSEGIDGDKADKLLRLSYENAQRLSRLVNDILDIEKIGAGKMEYRIEEEELCSLVADIVDSQFSYGERNGVTFDLQSGERHIYVSLDKDRFTQALVNLLSNAAKFSNWGDIVQVRIALLSDHKVRISVEDHGPGIPEAFRGKIFGKFAQADGSATRSQGGSGLGLNITKTIVEAFDGAVSYQSTEGEGTTFNIDLPVYRQAERRA